MASVCALSEEGRGTLSPLSVPDGTPEALKWVGLLLMTGDHVNKYLFNTTVPVLYEAGRAAVPLFVFVLAYNLARPGAFERGVYGRTMKRLAVCGTAASVPFIALGGLVSGWWPLNVITCLDGCRRALRCDWGAGGRAASGTGREARRALDSAGAKGRAGGPGP